MSSGLLRALAGPDLAVDLGSATTRVASAASRRTVSAPSVAGDRPAMVGGVVVDVAGAAAILRPLFARLRRLGLARPRVVASAPTDAGPNERLAVEEAVRRAGASAVAVFPEPVAAAVGAGLDLGASYAHLVVDIGHGVTDAAVVRHAAIVLARARRVGCGDLERRVRDHLVRHLCLEPDAGEVRDLLDLVWRHELVGRDERARTENRTGPDAPPPRRLQPGVPLLRGREVDLAALARDLAPVRSEIIDVVRGLLRDVPDETGAELVDSGITLTGGGALLPGLASCLARETGLAVEPVADPLNAVVHGGRALLAGLARRGAWSQSRQAVETLWR